MHRAVQVVIAFILALAIPLQGIAAATMAACGPGHAIGGYVGVEQPGQDAVAEAGDHHAMHHDAHTSPHGGSDAYSQSRHERTEKHSQVKCSVCASCCAGAAMPSTFVVFDSVEPTESFNPSVPTGTPGFLTAGLERPPRIFLA